MTDGHRPFPPSRGRLAAATRAGLLPRAPLLTAGVALSAAGGLLSILFLHQTEVFTAMLRDILSRSPTDLPETFARDAVTFLWTAVLVMVVPMIAAAVVPALLSPRGKGGTAVPLPAGIRPGIGYRVVSPLALTAAFLTALDALRPLGGLPPAPEAEITLVSTLGATGSALFRSGLILIGGGLVQLSLYKAALFQQLSLGSGDAARERRLHEPHPHLRRRIGRDPTR